MKYIFILLTTLAIFSCKKDVDDEATTPANPADTILAKIRADKSKVVFDMFHTRDTLTIVAPGPWEMHTTGSFHALQIARMTSDSNKLVLTMHDKIYDGNDQHTILRISMRDSADTGVLEIPVSQLAIARDTFAFGGDGDDEFNEAITDLGAVMVVGYSESSRVGDAVNHGGKDVWVKRMDRFGHSLWDRLLGGSGDDVATNIIKGWIDAGGTHKREGYLIGGYTYSNDGDVTGNHGSKDAWLVKIDSTGDIVWQKTLGTAHDEEIYEMFSTDDGNILISGVKNGDQWMCKVDELGNVIWERTFGGSSVDFSGSLSFDLGTYFFAGSGTAADGDVADKPTSTLDAWLVALSSVSGEIKWKQYIGGEGDDRGVSVLNLYGDEIYLVGTTESGDIFPDFSGERNIFVAAYNKWTGAFLYKNIIKHSNWDDLNAVSVTRIMEVVFIGKSRRQDFEGPVEDSYDGLIMLGSVHGANYARLIGGDRADDIRSIARGDFTQTLLIGSSSSYSTSDGQQGRNGWFNWLNYE